MSVTYSEYVPVVSIIQHTMRMRILYFMYGLSGCTILFHIISKQHDFRKKVIEHKVCFDFLYKACLTLRRTERDIIINNT
jgi:hypothetical protein